MNKKLEQRKMPSAYATAVANAAAEAAGSVPVSVENNELPADAQQERKAQLKTQGVKGCKLARINMGFTPDNHYFIQVASRTSGQTMTQFVNACLERYRNEHPEVMEAALAAQAAVESMLK